MDYRKCRYVQRDLEEELEEGEKRNVTLNWQTSSTEEQATEDGRNKINCVDIA